MRKREREGGRMREREREERNEREGERLNERERKCVCRGGEKRKGMREKMS